MMKPLTLLLFISFLILINLQQYPESHSLRTFKENLNDFSDMLYVKNLKSI